MTKNAKNQLHEFLQALGYETTQATFQTENLASGWESTVTVRFFCNRVVQGTGQGQRKTEAEIAASQNVIHRIYSGSHSH
ncbi:putative dsRNA-binding protein [Leptothoe spongobia]|uniref:DRBM domain-containing protein n=1 Tax=Leptothoe spongobia TAU-MAC 1115 TaxID=1967444 RepID=A0A947GJD9_9CYAN|nr:putative dsRNA-binding protein [Leptothoe spongobia]MBT9316915.1 hypothetical protein [Leptothoe spongobia TAU-MAC 1115]